MPPLVATQHVRPIVPVIELPFVCHNGEKVVNVYGEWQGSIVCSFDIRTHVELRGEADGELDLGRGGVMSEALQSFQLRLFAKEEHTLSWNDKTGASFLIRSFRVAACMIGGIFEEDRSLTTPGPPPHLEQS